MKILVIEDEPGLLQVVRTSLQREAYGVETAMDFAAALEKISIYEYDCILLDIMLPGGNGLQLLQELKSAGKSENVIIISAKDSLDDKIKGLELGADDYLTKPFHIAELNARVKAVLRRKKMDGKKSLDVANVQMYVSERQVLIDGTPLHLNRKEFDLLNYFLFNRNRLITREALAEHVWGDNVDQADNFDFIYYQIKNLRKKLQTAEAQLEIQAVYGVGYKLVVL